MTLKHTAIDYTRKARGNDYHENTNSAYYVACHSGPGVIYNPGQIQLAAVLTNQSIADCLLSRHRSHRASGVSPFCGATFHSPDGDRALAYVTVPTHIHLLD
jgi:hypothetical protein